MDIVSGLFGGEYMFVGLVCIFKVSFEVGHGVFVSGFVVPRLEVGMEDFLFGKHGPGEMDDHVVIEWFLSNAGCEVFGGADTCPEFLDGFSGTHGKSSSWRLALMSLDVILVYVLLRCWIS